MLCHSSRGIIDHINYRDSPFSAVIQIHIIKAGCKLTDKLQMARAIQGISIHRRFIHNNNICILNPFSCFLILRCHVEGNLSVLFQRLHRHILSHAASVQYHDMQSPLHNCSSHLSAIINPSRFLLLIP